MRERCLGLVYGLIVGLAYGLSATAGAFLGLPLLVLGLGFGVHAALPVALIAFALCTAIAAGDAVRARQCEPRLALYFAAAGVPAVVAASGLAQWLTPAAWAGLFALAAILVSLALLWMSRSGRSMIVVPAALWRAPRRSLTESASDPPRVSNIEVLRIVAAGLLSGAVIGACAAGALTGQRTLASREPQAPFQQLGSLLLGSTLVAVVAALVQFALAPAAPGYPAGLYVLGAVAGFGAARRFDRPRFRRGGAIAAAGLAMLAGVVLGVAVTTGHAS